jgi:hypothetical protein
VWGEALRARGLGDTTHCHIKCLCTASQLNCTGFTPPSQATHLRHGDAAAVHARTARAAAAKAAAWPRLPAGRSHDVLLHAAAAVGVRGGQHAIGGGAAGGHAHAAAAARCLAAAHLQQRRVDAGQGGNRITTRS